MKTMLLAILLASTSASAAMEPPEGGKCRAHYASQRSDFKEVAPGVWKGAVTARYYKTHTGIRVKAGQSVTITAKGRVCWEMAWRCAGPEGSALAWGLRVRIGEQVAGFERNQPLGTTVTSDGEIVFVIYEGSSGGWDDANCIYYGDNTGRYSVTVTIS